MNIHRKRQHLIAAGVVAVYLWATMAVGLAATDFQRLYAEAVRAQEAGNFVVAAQKFTEAAELAPTNTAVLLRLAMVRGYLREYDAALEVVDRGLAIDPRNTDLRLARGRILGWAGRYDEARRMVDAVIAEQPRNAEAYTIRGRTEYYQGRLDPASLAFAEALRIDPNNADARAGLADVEKARKATLAGDGRPSTTWRIDTGYVYSQLSRANLADWREGFVRIERAWPSDTALSFRVDSSNRFDTEEQSIGAAVRQRFSPALYGHLEGSVAPDGNFLPRSMLAGGGSLRIFEGDDENLKTFLTVDLRHRRYRTGDIQNIDPGVEQYAFDGRLWVAAKWINAFDRKADRRLAGWYGRADWQVVPAFRVFAGASVAPETEGGVTVDTQSRFGGLAFDLTSSLRLNLDLSHQDRENSYIRDVYGLGLTLRY